MVFFGVEIDTEGEKSMNTETKIITTDDVCFTLQPPYHLDIFFRDVEMVEEFRRFLRGIGLGNFSEGAEPGGVRSIEAHYNTDQLAKLVVWLRDRKLKLPPFKF